MSRYDRKDRLYRQAKEEGYRSRAAYKLLELNQKYHFLNSNKKVLDLGSFPGGWLQVASSCVGKHGTVVGIDLRNIEPFTPAELKGGTLPIILQGDLNAPDMQAQLLNYGLYNAVISDISPHLTGITARDNADFAELLTLVFNVALKMLQPSGWFVSKIFPSHDVDQIIQEHKTHFAKLSRTVLKSSRNTSIEMYLVGQAK